MGLEQIAKEVQSFINESYKATVEYRKLESDLQEKVKNGLRGSVEVEQELEYKKQRIHESLSTKAEKLSNKLESVRKEELKKIDETSESITADTLAELNLLSQLELTSDDISDYINKYKHTPLALRKLQEIARDKNIMSEFPPDRKQYLNVVLGRMSNSLSKFKRPNYDDYDVKTKIVADGAINGHGQDVLYYRSL